MCTCVCIDIHVIVSPFCRSQVQQRAFASAMRHENEGRRVDIDPAGQVMHVCVCVYVCMYVCVYVCMYACKYVCMFVYVRVYLHENN